MIIDIFFEYICPVLIVLWIVSGFARLAGVKASSGSAIKGLLLLFSLAIALYPVRGLSVSDYILSINPNFSIGSMVLLLIIVNKRMFNKDLLSHKDLVTFSIWNIFIYFIVLIPALGFTGLDIYASGYGFSLLFVAMAVVTICLIYIKSPLSYIFIAYIVTFNLNLLASENLLDYITDGTLLFISLAVLFLPFNKPDNNY